MVMTDKKAKADVTPVRQRTQYTCMSTSLMMCLQALGHKVNEDEVNDVMGARPKKGAAWENAIAAAQHYGCRATLVTPSTVQQLKSWTDRGIPVMIAWNPEGRPWSHASVVFDVDEDLNVYVADPNIPDPDETVRIVPKGEFYSKWSEKWPDYIVRRPAMAVEREITPDGRQVIPVVERTTPDGGLIPVAVMAAHREAKKLDTLWMVTEPTQNSEIIDILVGVSDWNTLRNIMVGSPDWKRIKPSFHDDLRSAKADAMGRLSRLWGRDVPDWVMQSSRGGFRMATKTASSRIQQQPLMTMPDYGLSMEERWERGFQEPKTAANWDLWAEASKLAVAMVYDGAWGGKDASLVWDAVVHAPRDNAEATQEPERWARLVQKHKSTMSKIPGRVGVKFNQNGMVFPAKGTDKRTMQWINDNFQFLGPFITGKLDKAKAKRNKLELQKKHVTLLLNLMLSFLAKRPNRFIESLRDQLDRRGYLSTKQLDAAWKILADEPNGANIVSDFRQYQAQGWDPNRPPKYASINLGVHALEQSLGRDVSALWKVLSKQYDRISLRVDDHKFIAFYYEGRDDGSTFVDEVIDLWEPIARKHKLRKKPQNKGADFVSFGLPRRAFREGSRIVANDTDSGAGSDEDKFYQDPEKREVLEFARSKAISNSVEVAIDHAKELDIPLKQELKDVAKAPPLPTEIVDEPGGAAVSTLNRYVIKTDDPAVEPAAKMNKDRMAFWKAELEQK